MVSPADAPPFTDHDSPITLPVIGNPGQSTAGTPPISNQQSTISNVPPASFSAAWPPEPSPTATDYGYIKGQQIVCTVPAGLNGSQELSVTGTIQGSLRTGVYSIPLLP